LFFLRLGLLNFWSSVEVEAEELPTLVGVAVEDFCQSRKAILVLVQQR